MKKQRILLATLVATFCQVAMAGGYLTNTNHSIAFVREPSRDAAIGIDGAYSNPAGLLFMPKGLQIQFNYQNVAQHRYIESTFEPFKLGEKNNGSATKKFEGAAKAPILPSFHITYNPNEKWNFNGSFAVVGGGGKCEFGDGLASFESVLPALAIKNGLLDLNSPKVSDKNSYDLDCSLTGKQYYFGVQVGVGYKINEHLAVSLQGRIVIGKAGYDGYLKNIKMNGQLAYDYLSTTLPTYLNGVATDCLEKAEYYNGLAEQALAGASQYEALGMTAEAEALRAQAAQAKGGAEQYAAGAAQAQAGAAQAQGLAPMTRDITLDCDQSGIGFIPIIGIDWHPNKHWNFAAKYEFNTKMRLKNSSNVTDQMVAAISALNQFKDGNKVPEDMPALLTVGVMYSPIDAIRINAGYHCYFDQNAKKYGDSQNLLDGNTMEYSAGIEWDFCKNWTVSGGAQYAKYANTDAYMKDISFNTNAATYGFGFQYRLGEHWDIDVAYFFSKYDKWTKKSDSYNGTGIPGQDIFWRDNKVFGLGVTYKLGK